MTPFKIFVTALFLVFSPSLSEPSFSSEMAETHFKQGMEYNKRGQYIKSREELIKAVHLSIETNKFHQALVFNFIQTRSGPKGIAFYKDMVNKHPNTPTVHYWLGRLYLQRNSFQEAAPEFKKATQLAPQDDHAFIALGHTYWKMGNVDGAFKAYDQANQLTPNVAIVNEGLGNVYFKRKEYPQARTVYEQALQLDPSLNESRFYLGIIYEKQAQFEKAIAQWNAILESDPNVSEAREKLARLYFMGEQYEDAAREYSMILKVRPGSPEIYMAFGESLVLLADSTEDTTKIAQLRNSAIDAFQHTLDFDPGNAKARKYLEALKVKGASPK
jgi:cytochrome c-type biogenesis protein CcmH/NrfG